MVLIFQSSFNLPIENLFGFSVIELAYVETVFDWKSVRLHTRTMLKIDFVHVIMEHNDKNIWIGTHISTPLDQHFTLGHFYLVNVTLTMNDIHK